MWPYDHITMSNQRWRLEVESPLKGITFVAASKDRKLIARILVSSLVSLVSLVYTVHSRPTAKVSGARQNPATIADNAKA
jgi:hypothetical protein